MGTRERYVPQQFRYDRGVEVEPRRQPLMPLLVKKKACKSSTHKPSGFWWRFREETPRFQKLLPNQALTKILTVGIGVKFRDSERITLARKAGVKTESAAAGIP